MYFGRLLRVSLLGTGLFGCAGNISDPDQEPAAPRGPGVQVVPKKANDSTGVAPGAAGAGGQAMPGTSAPLGSSDSATALCKGGVQVGPSLLRRLTNQELLGTLRDLFRLAPTAPMLFELPAESTVNNFENAAALQGLSEQHLSLWNGMIRQLSEDLMSSATRRPQVVGCEPVGAARATCVRGFIERFGRRAYRRPLKPAEIDALVAMSAQADSDADSFASIGLAVRAILGSSRFQFIVDAGTPVPGRPDLVKLDGYSLAARAALLTWGVAPDGALLDAARDGKLSTRDGLDAVVAGMLADPRSRSGQNHFFERWLRLNEVQDADRDTKIFKPWNDELRRSMPEETRLFVGEVAWKSGSDFRDILSSPTTFVNTSLATLYGIKAPAGLLWQKTTLVPMDGRRGLLTQASFLTASGRLPKANAILRGKLVQDALLCTTLEVPNDVPPLDATAPMAGASDRQHLEQHRSTPQCAVCHSFLDSVGFGLDAYDGIGRARTVDSRGKPIDTRGRLIGAEAPDFEGPMELETKLRQMPRFSECITRQLYQYAAGRPVSGEDECAISQIHAEWKASGFAYPDLLKALVHSDAFGHRMIDTRKGVSP